MYSFLLRFAYQCLFYTPGILSFVITTIHIFSKLSRLVFVLICRLAIYLCQPTLNSSDSSSLITIVCSITIGKLHCNPVVIGMSDSPFQCSGVAKLVHTGARALASRGCAPPVQALLKIIIAECTVINRESGAKTTQSCSEVDLRSIGTCIYILRITRSRSQCVFAESTTVTSYAARVQVCSEGMVEVLQIQGDVQAYKVASEST